MRPAFILFAILFVSNSLLAQFAPAEKGLTIIVTDGTEEGRNSELQPKSSEHAAKGIDDAPNPNAEFGDPIRPLGMNDAIQAAAFLERPTFGKAGFLLVFCVNDSIDKKKGTLFINGKTYRGVYRLIRQKFSLDEEMPEGMRPYRLGGTVFFLGIS